MRILSSRRATLAPYHYEALITAYARFGDLTTAFRILTIMAKAGVEPTPSTTRPLFVHLSQDHTLPRHAWQTLQRLFDDGHAVPIAAVNVVLESFIAVHQFEDALETYKNLHTICEAGPDTETFNVLFQGSTRAKRKDVSMFLASEMHALGIPADNLTYDRLILVCLNQTDYEDAFRYLDEMVQVGADRVEEGTGRVGWWMRKGTAKGMVRTCVKFMDERVWDLLREMKKRGMDTSSLENWVRTTWTGPPEAPLEPVVKDLRARQEERLRLWKAVN
jgi:pentatricopeptide repeat protein